MSMHLIISNRFICPFPESVTPTLPMQFDSGWTPLDEHFGFIFYMYLL